jgi:L-rhamnose mutarotase
VGRAAFVLSVRPERLDAYIEAHEHVWPEMLEALRLSGIHNYTIFRNGTTLFGYLEADDLDAAWAHLAASDVNQRWQSVMAEYLEARVADEGPPLLPEVFRLD